MIIANYMSGGIQLLSWPTLDVWPCVGLVFGRRWTGIKPALGRLSGGLL